MPSFEYSSSSVRTHWTCVLHVSLLSFSNESWSGLGDCLFLSGLGNERKVRTPKGRVLGNAQAEQSDMSATENIPPMAGIFREPLPGKGEMVG